MSQLVAYDNANPTEVQRPVGEGHGVLGYLGWARCLFKRCPGPAWQEWEWAKGGGCWIQQWKRAPPAAPRTR